MGKDRSKSGFRLGKCKISIVCLCLLATVTAFGAEEGVLRHEVPRELHAVVRDGQGQDSEGVLRFHVDMLHVETNDRKEKWIPVKYIRSITLEKNRTNQLNDPFQQETAYVVRVENSQEIYTLKDKYSFSLNTQLGLVTQDIDPDLIQTLFSRDRSTVSDKPLSQDKSIVVKIELKF